MTRAMRLRVMKRQFRLAPEVAPDGRTVDVDRLAEAALDTLGLPALTRLSFEDGTEEWRDTRIVEEHYRTADTE